MTEPQWTVLYNIASRNSNWVGTGWEFFDNQDAAMDCYLEHKARGNVPTIRPYYRNSDREHLGAAHRMSGARQA